uniref:NADH-ubiquinone oxidoreductase chain 3 n=1 Tax=Allobathynella sp. JHS-2017 TaxID=2025385 RepID=A0A7R6D8I4_9CRUS|nr:NADH dehydrogenase subunit 3 [Allobathynella sp. JHS-2017]
MTSSLNSYLLFPMLISLTLMLMCLSLMEKINKMREENSPFECGYDPKSEARLPFSLHFFNLAVLFIIFDLETAFLLASMKIHMLKMPMLWMIITLSFVLILILGLMYEWTSNMLDWAN